MNNHLLINTGTENCILIAESKIVFFPVMYIILKQKLRFLSIYHIMVNWLAWIKAKKCILFICAFLITAYFGYLRNYIFTKGYQNKEFEAVIPWNQRMFVNDNLTSLDRLVYNRVPKCASATTSKLIAKLADRNGYKVLFVLKFGPKNLNNTGQLEVIEKARSAATPWIYIQHFHMIDFKDYGETMPVHINMIRDPIERKMSGYYYLRFKSPRKMSPERRNMTFDDCVKSDDAECTGQRKLFTIVPYFCGSNPKCLDPSPWALNRAIQNVERYYSIIGYVEEIEKFYYTLEKTLPQYFRGLGGLYRDYVELFKDATSNKHPKFITEESRDYLKSLLGYEYQFYNFIKIRFQEQYAKITTSRNNIFR